MEQTADGKVKRVTSLHGHRQVSCLQTLKDAYIYSSYEKFSLFRNKAAAGKPLNYCLKVDLYATHILGLHTLFFKHMPVMRQLSALAANMIHMPVSNGS